MSAAITDDIELDVDEGRLWLPSLRTHLDALLPGNLERGLAELDPEGPWSARDVVAYLACRASRLWSCVSDFQTLYVSHVGKSCEA